MENLIKEIREELNNLDKGLINDLVQKALKTKKISIDNLDNSVTNFIMKNAGTQAKPFEIPESPTQEFFKTCGERKPIFDENTEAIMTDILIGNNVYLHGKAGTGKTYLAEMIAEYRLGRDRSIINCSQWTSPINIIGGETIKGYRQGTMIEAWKKGHILILDELPKLDPNTAGLLNEALAKTADKAEPCETYYEGDLKVGAKLYYGAKDAEGKARKKYVSGVLGIYDSETGKGTFYWVQKMNDELGEITMIEENEVLYFDEKFKPKRTWKSGEPVNKYPTVTDGKGIRQPKHPLFGVIATGNTDLKSVDAKFSGNNRQDYSLVDRFAGSYYKIDFNTQAEQLIIYSQVYDVCIKIREWMNEQGGDMIENISLRTMLNFNRIYELDCMQELSSPYLEKQLEKLGSLRNNLKKYKDSIMSFVKSLNETQSKSLEQHIRQDIQMLDMDRFKEDFKKIRGIDPETGEKIGE